METRAVRAVPRSAALLKNFLKGMETAAGVIQDLPAQILKNFLKGMETSSGRS